MRPRVGFLGTGWIGRHRMAAMIESGAIEPVALCDPSPDCAAEAARAAPAARVIDSFETMLDMGLDGIVIATPSALHADQAIRALESGAAVFCQKPLGRNAAEARAVVDAARAADRLLAVDFSYRLTAAMQAIAPLVAAGELGDIFAVDLVFHNAYGPDKDWFYDRVRSGGGCLIDLGVHLIDLALWTLGFPEIVAADAAMFSNGRPAHPAEVEDYVVATLRTASGAAIRLACSWRLPAGRDAIIEARFYGTGGGAALRNLGGSFYDFAAERYRGTATEALAAPLDDWGGRAAIAWAERLAEDARFDAAAEELVRVAEIVDRLYRAGGIEPTSFSPDA
ncbi:MAG: Gfo/Idh/MocA family protein [Sphingomonas sp.]